MLLYFELVKNETEKLKINDPKTEEFKKKSDENFDALLKDAQEKGKAKQQETFGKLQSLVDKLKTQKEKIDMAKKEGGKK